MAEIRNLFITVVHIELDQTWQVLLFPVKSNSISQGLIFIVGKGVTGWLCYTALWEEKFLIFDNKSTCQADFLKEKIVMVYVLLPLKV